MSFCFPLCSLGQGLRCQHERNLGLRFQRDSRFVMKLPTHWIPCVLALSLLPAAAAVVTDRRAVFSQASDASAAILVGTNYMVVGNDEDNRLRIYQLDTPGPPVDELDCSEFLGVQGKNTEVDIEGSARIGDRVYWIGSHGADRLGRPAPNRHRLFATDIQGTEDHPRLKCVEKPYSSLLEDLDADPRYRKYRLLEAATHPPKSQGGLNIEGLCATPEGYLLIGFRNPLPKSKALIVALMNPADVVDGRPAQFGAPLLIDLDGLGIRDLAFWKGHYLILAGSIDGERHFKLFDWFGPGRKPTPLSALSFKHFNPEALALCDRSDEGVILSDDGTRRVHGVESKSLPDINQRRFHARWISLPELGLQPVP